MTNDEKKTFLAKLNESGKSANEFNQLNKNYWKGRLILGIVLAVMLVLFMYFAK